MNTCFRRLHLFVTDSVSPEALASGVFCAMDFERWRRFLRDCSCELRLLLSEQMMGVSTYADRRLWMSSFQENLLVLSDQVNGYLIRCRRMWETNSSADLIRSHYILTLECFQGLLNYAREKFDVFVDLALRMSSFELFAVRPVFREMVASLGIHMERSAVDKDLSALLLDTLRSVCRSSAFSLGDLRYYQALAAAVMAEVELSSERLVELLIAYDFNKPGFYLYIVSRWAEMLEALEGMHEQLEKMLAEQDLLNGQLLISSSRAFSNHASLKQDLLRFCREKKEHLQELIALRRMAAQDELDMREAVRILSGFTVPQISLFLKLQVEKGLLVPDSLAGLYRFISRHFYTSKALMISEKSLKREYEDVKFSTAYKMYLVLLEFIEWLDELFQVKSYKPA